MKYTVAYFPYLFMKDVAEVKIGNATVWNFDIKSEEYLPEVSLRNKVKSLIEMNVGYEDRPVRGVGIFSIGGKSLFSQNENLYEKVAEVKLLLFLAGLSASMKLESEDPNVGHQLTTAENYAPVFQNFDTDSDYVAESTGFIVRMQIGGHTVGETKYRRPSFVLTPLQYRLDHLLVSRLVAAKKRNKKFFNRVLLSAEAVYDAYFNNPTMTVGPRIMAQSRAFEVLLELPEEQKTKKFREAIDRYLSLNISEEKYRTYRVRKHDGTFLKERGSIKKKWAQSFYSLRSKIIHGDSIRSRDYVFENKQHHFLIATLFYLFLVKKITYEKIGRKYYNQIQWKTREIFHSESMATGFIYEDRQLWASIMARFNRSRRIHRT